MVRGVQLKRACTTKTVRILISRTGGAGSMTGSTGSRIIKVIWRTRIYTTIREVPFVGTHAGIAVI
jgi:hypothetical protein